MQVYKQLLNYKEVSANEAEITLVNKTNIIMKQWLRSVSFKL